MINVQVWISSSPTRSSSLYPMQRFHGNIGRRAIRFTELGYLGSYWDKVGHGSANADSVKAR